MIVRLAEGDLKTKYGRFEEYLYYDGQKETIVLIKGEIEDRDNVLCRIHSACIFGHYFNSIECDCQEQMDISQQLIAQADQGIIILMDQEGKGNGHFALLNSVNFKRKGIAQGDAYQKAGFKRDNRDFSAAAKILKDLKVKSIQMLTNNSSKIDSMTIHGVVVLGTKSIVL